ncbi:MAG: gliding motility-associated C-terminal domain-containing protein [Bacteroidota bacterium]
MKLVTPLLFLFVGLLPNLLGAQIGSPDFRCILNDTLVWTNMPVGCGPFEATEVYVATTPDGPYTLLAELTDITTERYFDVNPGGELRFYFLRYRFDCPGQTASNSDTLDNRIPLPPSATWVSVEDNTVVVHWTPSSSPEVSGYLIYRREPQGLIVIGQVSGAGTVTYVDNSFSEQPDAESYRVTSIDDCGNNSLFGPEVTTAQLDIAGGNGCTSSITLIPEGEEMAAATLPYVSWNLFVTVNNNIFEIYENAGPAVDSFVYDEANNGEIICFYAEGQLQGEPDRLVRTPIACSIVDITQPVRAFPLFGAGFDLNGNLVHDFGWDATAETSLLEAQVTDANGVLSVINLPFMGLVGPEATGILPFNDLPALEPFSLSLRAEDVCGNVVITNTVFPVFLNGQVNQPGSNSLNWSLFSNELTDEITYNLIRRGLDGTRTIIYSGTETSFIDDVGVADPNLAQSCYQVETTVIFPDGDQRIYLSQERCLEQQPMVYLPNVFSPVAESFENQEFCPGFSRRPTGDYQLDIYDRWGGRVFTTQDPLRCWDGTWRGQPANTGVYLYVLRMEQGNRVIEEKGDVTLLW